ncbi:undecaprenyl-phosphate glucose phosphotransferase [Thiomicrospira microaerophila]|uniref:undecaprenyl-phosphate glucose phosphotransferase n=1 Tax=Thiomicrospira microaerophila TaxID=406020 RepID=UPI0005C9EFBE|nr:undecaprenyl-phosphate glucose phosphotransferase [Thiomicrospira microaerophila]
MGHRKDFELLLWIQRLLDLSLPLLTLMWLEGLRHADDPTQPILIALFAGLVYLISAQLLGVYRDWLDRSITAILSLAIKAALIATVLGTLLILSRPLDPIFSLALLIQWFSLFLTLLIGYRILIISLLIGYRRFFRIKKTVVICGQNEIGQQLANMLQTAPWLGYQFNGFLDHQVQSPDPATYDEVFICLPTKEEAQIKHLLNHFANSTKVVRFVPDLFSFDIMQSNYTNLNGIPVFSVFDSPLKSISARLLKRLFDLTFASLILLIIWPLMLLIALLIKATSAGPVFFKQIRYGLDGKEINVLKFRSMSVCENGDHIPQAQPNDPRITPLGRILRSNSLDELPQLINVLKGNMSLVGPRPHAKAHNELYRQLIPQYMQRHLVKPGITGWAQVNGWRGETDKIEKMQKRVEFDLHYIKNWSLALDIRILLLTVLVVLTRKNAR